MRKNKLNSLLQCLMRENNSKSASPLTPLLKSASTMSIFSCISLLSPSLTCKALTQTLHPTTSNFMEQVNQEKRSWSGMKTWKIVLWRCTLRLQALRRRKSAHSCGATQMSRSKSKKIVDQPKYSIRIRNKQAATARCTEWRTVRASSTGTATAT